MQLSFQVSRKQLKSKNLIKFNKGKYSPGMQHRLGSIHLGSRPVEVELGVLVNNKLDEWTLCCCGKEANRMMGGITRALPAQKMKSISHSTQCLPGHAWNTMFRFGPFYIKKMWPGWGGSGERPLGSLPCEERLRELGCTALRNEGLRETSSLCSRT